MSEHVPPLHELCDRIVHGRAHIQGHSPPAATAALDRWQASCRETLSGAGVDLQDPQVARALVLTYLACCRVIEREIEQGAGVHRATMAGFNHLAATAMTVADRHKSPETGGDDGG